MKNKGEALWYVSVALFNVFVIVLLILTASRMLPLDS